MFYDISMTTPRPRTETPPARKTTFEVALALSLHKPYDRQIVTGIARFLSEQDDWRLYVEDEPDRKLPDRRRWSGDGVIADLDDRNLARRARQLQIPVVGVGGAVNEEANPGVHYVGTDNDAIGRMGAEHLMDCGFRSFGYCGLRPNRTTQWATSRQASFVEQLKEAGLETSVHVGRAQNTTNWESVQAGLTQWLDRIRKPAGIMACNDARARHVLEACHRQKLRVPDDIALLGVDDDEIICLLGDPPISSIIQGTEQIGYTAARILETLMRGDRVPDRFQIVPPRGVRVRGSTDVIATSQPQVARAVSLIRTRLETITGTAVCDALSVSRPRLDQLFERELGHSLHGQIKREKLRRAKHLLGTTDLPLKVVASRSGYRSPQYLSEVFRSETRETPAHFRRQRRQ